MADRWPLEHSDLSLTNVHPESACAGRHCTIHNRSDHHMRSWRQHWRDDRRIMERLCPEHGVGHPDPDSPWADGSPEWIHGCCGCCREDATIPVGDIPEQESDLVENLEAMAEIIDLSAGEAVVVMLSGSMFAEAAAEIRCLRAALEAARER